MNDFIKKLDDFDINYSVEERVDINRGGNNWEIAVEYGLLAIGEIV